MEIFFNFLYRGRRRRKSSPIRRRSAAAKKNKRDDKKGEEVDDECWRDGGEDEKSVDEVGENDVSDVLLYMDKHKVEQITSKLAQVKFTATNRQLPGVNYVRTPDNLKQLVEANKKKGYPAGKFLSYFMDFLYDNPCRNIDSSFAPITDEKMSEILDACELSVPRTGKKTIRY